VVVGGNMRYFPAPDWSKYSQVSWYDNQIE